MNWSERWRESSAWLERYLHLLSDGELVLDLGCGVGDDSVELDSFGCRVVSLDLDPERVRQVPVSAAVGRVAGDAVSLPFADNAFNCVVSSLSLHYFTGEDTRRAFAEVARVLAPDSWLICRVNAVGDVNFGYAVGEEVEPSLFRQPEGHLKRFFNKEMLHRFLDPCFRLEQITPRTILQRGIEKQTLECVALNRG